MIRLWFLYHDLFNSVQIREYLDCKMSPIYLSCQGTGRISVINSLLLDTQDLLDPFPSEKVERFRTLGHSLGVDGFQSDGRTNTVLN